MQVGALAAFGGGILSALLIQDPKRAAIPLLSSNTVGVTWTVCWWLVNYFPGNLVSSIISFLPIKIITKVTFEFFLGSPEVDTNQFLMRLPWLWNASRAAD
jgi:hypothetical protein